MEPPALFIGEPVSNSTAGLVGEHIAASAILQRGWSCAMTQQDKYDLIAVLNRESFRVQVKSCALSHRITSKRGARTLQFLPGIGRKKRMPTPEDFDILCLVSSETRACLFLPVGLVAKAKLTKSIHLFTPENEADSWTRTIEVLRNDITSKPPPLHHDRPRNGSVSNSQLSPEFW